MYLKRPDGLSAAAFAGFGHAASAENTRLPAADVPARPARKPERRGGQALGTSLAVHVALGGLLLLVRVAPTLAPAPEFAIPFVWEAPPAAEPSVGEPAREMPSGSTAPAPAEAASSAPAPPAQEAAPPPEPLPVAPSISPETTLEAPSMPPEPTPLPAPSPPATAVPQQQRPEAPPARPSAFPGSRTEPAPPLHRKGAPVAHAPGSKSDRPLANPGQAGVASAPPRTAPLVVAAHPVTGMSTNRPPAYPPLAQRRREEGSVVVRVDVSADGQPRSVLVLRGSGHALLDEAAAAAVRQWRFVPATSDNVPIAAIADVPVDFKLPHS